MKLRQRLLAVLVGRHVLLIQVIMSSSCDPGRIGIGWGKGLIIAKDGLSARRVRVKERLLSQRADAISRPFGFSEIENARVLSAPVVPDLRNVPLSAQVESNNTKSTYAEVVLLPAEADLEIEALGDQAEQVCQKGVRFVNAELLDALREGLVDVEGLQAGDWVGADYTER